ncbi:MAG: ABC transporter ATP-binding protein [Deltaproteobacteria bacterium]|nr:MAG: ABC transporter ATP-binding protein [Deltaproteobacteria bacterium]
MHEETLLNVSNLDTFYGGIQALWNVSLEVKHEEIVALVGANGSGKSTLLDTISGLIHPAKGGIEFEGKSITNLDPFQIVDLGISQVPEGRRIFPDLSVLDNLILGSYNRKARSKKEQNFKMVYELFPILKERKNQLAKTLSGGEQQMLVLGRGLMSDPKLMLLDEMSLGLAPIVIDELYMVLREIRSRGITVIFVEQNVRRSLEEADRAYILEAGHIVLSGNAADLREEEKVKKAYFGI